MRRFFIAALVLCLGVSAFAGTIDVPGKWLYAGESPVHRMYIVENGKVVWDYVDPDGRGEISDAMLLDNGNILMAHQHGISEVSPEKKVVWRYAAPKGTEIHTVQPLGEDYIVYIQNEKPLGKVLVMRKADHSIVHSFLLPVKQPASVHGQFRCARLTPRGTYLVANMGLGFVAEYDWDGKELTHIDFPGAWGVEILPDGHWLLTSNQRKVAEYTPDGGRVWSLDLDAYPELGIRSTQKTYKLDDGNLLVGNWLNEWNRQEREARDADPVHAPAQFVIVTPDGKNAGEIRSWKDPDLGPSTTWQPMDRPVVRRSMKFVPTTGDPADLKARTLLMEMTLDEKLSLVTGEDWMYTKAVERLGVPRLRMSDGPQGLGTHGPSTAYPSTVLLASTWNEELALSYGHSLGRDARARGVDILLGPAVNIYRAPWCGRNFEYMGEDPYLASRIAVSYIKGVQDEGVIATVKHFLGNNSDYDRDNISNDMDERTLHEIYLPVFRAAVQEAGVGALMTSYNLVNGVWTTENPYLLKDILRTKWGFKGIVMSDWNSLHNACLGAVSGLDLEMPGGKMNPSALKDLMRAGLLTEEEIDTKVFHLLRTMTAFGVDKPRQDSGDPPDDPRSAQVALDVAREGIVLLKNERKVLPLNAKKIRSIVVVGANASGYVKGGGSGEVKPFHNVSLLDGIMTRASRAGIRVSLLDELDYMPDLVYTDRTLSRKGLAASYFPNMTLSGSPVCRQTESRVSYSWTGAPDIEGMPSEKYSASWEGVVCAPETAEYELLYGGDDGFRLYLDGQLVTDEWKNGSFRTRTLTRTFEAGVPHDIRLEYYQDGGGAGVRLTWKKMDSVSEPLKNMLAGADIVIACIGHNSTSEGEGRDREFGLPESDLKLLEQVSETKTPVVAVVNAGGNVAVSEWQDRVDALLWAGYAGQEAGTAVAEILFGDVNPSGHLPMTFEKRWEDNPVYATYHDTDKDKRVAYDEGVFVGYRGYDRLGREVAYPFGHGLSYTDFSLSGGTVTRSVDGTFVVECRVKNTGRRSGSAVIQAYVGPAFEGKVERPGKQLKGFRKVTVAPGKTVTVHLTLPRDAFSYYDVDTRDFVTEHGTYNVMLGLSSRDIRLTESIDL